MASIQSRHGQQDKAEQERLVIERFCARHREDARVIGPNQPPAPDFTIAIAGREVLVELTQYREQGPHNEAATRDWEFKRQVSERLRSDPDLSQLSLILSYQESDGRFVVPRLVEVEKLFSMLKALTCEVDPRSCKDVVSVRFVPEEKTNRYNRWCRRTKRRYVAIERHSILARCFLQVMFRCHPAVETGLPVTSLNSRIAGLDLNEIKRVLLHKTGKVPQYRQKAENRDVWLLFYSEGWPSTAHVWKSDVPIIVDHLRQLINEADHRFDSVWWGNNLLTEPGQSLYMI